MQEIGRRRRWSFNDKMAAVELSLAPDGGVAAVAATIRLRKFSG